MLQVKRLLLQRVFILMTTMAVLPASTMMSQTIMPDFTECTRVEQGKAIDFSRPIILRADRRQGHINTVIELKLETSSLSIWYVDWADISPGTTCPQPFMCWKQVSLEEARVRKVKTILQEIYQEQRLFYFYSDSEFEESFCFEIEQESEIQGRLQKERYYFTMTHVNGLNSIAGGYLQQPTDVLTTKYANVKPSWLSLLALFVPLNGSPTPISDAARSKDKGLIWEFLKDYRNGLGEEKYYLLWLEEHNHPQRSKARKCIIPGYPYWYATYFAAAISEGEWAILEKVFRPQA